MKLDDFLKAKEEQLQNFAEYYKQLQGAGKDHYPDSLDFRQWEDYYREYARDISPLVV